MLNLRSIGGVLGILALSAGAAMAGDRHDWSGLYIGGVGTYTSADGQHCDNQVCLPGFPDVSPKGQMGGVTAGYNFQSSNWVFGIEADWSWGDVSDVGSTSVVFGCGVGPGACVTDIESIGTVRARAGVAFDRLLVYATAGVAVTRYDVSLGIPPATGGSQTETTFAGGAGLEYAFGSNWSAKLEYLFIDELGDFAYDNASACGLAPNNCFSRVEHLNNLRAGVNFSF
jgi:outer membrane immunogenic protein